MNSPVLSIRDLQITRGGVRILKKINWTVRAGENWVILGSNGSGKTCLLKALAGYMPPTDGEISVLEETFGESDWRELREKIGVVSASISQMIHDEDLAVEIVAGGYHAMVGYWGRITKAEYAHALGLLTTLRVKYLAERPWEVLSQGERQRVLIARALVAKPKILILDEPCTGLDPVARERFLDDLARLLKRRDRPSVILVTHHIEEILPAFTHILALRKGRVEYCAPKTEVLRSGSLGKLFGRPMSVQKSRGRYWLKVRS